MSSIGSWVYRRSMPVFLCGLLLGSCTVFVQAVPAVPQTSCAAVLSPGADVQQALNRVGASGPVCLTAGSYTASEPILLAAGQQLLGLQSAQGRVILRSTAPRIVKLSRANLVAQMTLQGNSPAVSEFGILVFQQAASNSIVRNIRIENVKIGVGINDSSNVTLDGVEVANSGIRGDGRADPAIWIIDSAAVSVMRSTLRGEGGRQRSGDGELACYDSSNISVIETRILESGASAIYFVNCDNSLIERSDIESPSEWGLDIVRDQNQSGNGTGSDNVVIKDNTVRGAEYGGLVYDRFNQGGQYINNRFENNNQSRNNAFCNGINEWSAAGSYLCRGSNLSL